MRYIFFLLLISGCKGLDLPPSNPSGTIAVNIEESQVTTCKQECYSEYVSECYMNLETELEECVPICPLQNKGYICIDLYKDKEERNKYVLTPLEWEGVSHLFGLYSNKQVSDILSNIEFICEKDFAYCKKSYKKLEELNDFLFKDDR